MPIHLYWGDDEAARQRALADRIEALVDPTWASINLSRLDGADSLQAARALEEARTPPFRAGARVVVVQRSPFCQACPAELAAQLEAAVALVPDDCHLFLVSDSKPDARLRTTKRLRTLADEQSFTLPPVWDGAGQIERVESAARARGLTLAPGAAEALAEAIGSDGMRLASELEKLALHAGSAAGPITAESVAALIGGQVTSSLAVGDALLAQRPAEAIALVEALLEVGEPALRIVAALASQIRGWLWVCLLERSGEQDVAVIAKAAGIGNPKRIYVMRKQIRGRSPEQLLALLRRLLDVEAALKRGADPGDAFRDGFLLAALAQPGSAPRR